MHTIKNIFRVWLPIAVVTAALFTLAYSLVQQSMRMDLNDPQVQMAEDAAYALDHGAAIEAVAGGPKVEMSLSLMPFLVIYDPQGQPVTGSGLLDGQLPDYPKGALEAAKLSGENRVSWQPNSNVRIASVVVPYQNGFVLAGRNMREVESRISDLTSLSAAAFLLTCLATLGVITAGEIFLKEKK